MTADATLAVEGQLPSGGPSPVGQSERTTKRVMLGVTGWVALVYLGEFFAVVRANREWLIHRMPDDAYYYLQIGRHIARGHGATFDGIHRTDGFHPLWQLMVAAIARISPSGLGYPKAVLAVALCISLAATLALMRFLARAFGPLPATAGTLLAVHSTGVITHQVDGMEGALAVAGLVLCLVEMARVLRAPSVQGAARLGVATGLAILARLDLAIIVPVLGIVLIWRLRRRELVAAWGLAALLVTSPFLIWNLLRSHRLLTVSGYVKVQAFSTYVRRTWGGHLSVGYLAYVARAVGHQLTNLERDMGSNFVSARGVAVALTAHIALLLASVGLAIVVARHLHRSGPQMRWSPEVIATATMLLIVAMKLVVDEAANPLSAGDWYSPPQRLALAFVLGYCIVECLAWLRSYWRPVFAVASSAVFLAVLPAYLQADVRGSHTQQVDQSSWADADASAAGWIRASATGGTYGSPDAGILGYLLDGRPAIVDLDGLVNDYRYADALARGVAALARYRTEGVRYLVGRLSRDRPVDPGCGRVLWTSPEQVRDGGTLLRPIVDELPVEVIDLGTCS